MKHTHARVLFMEDATELTDAIAKLPFQVEIKTYLKKDDLFYCFFNLPDHLSHWTNEKIERLVDVS